jgi:Icc-related predicted phosphoesterase
MKIHLVSDIHTEFKYYFIPEMEDEEDTIVIFAGDIGIAKRPETTYLPTIKNACDRFKHVFMVLGNHEHWHGNFPTTYSKIWTETLEYINFDLLEKETKVIDGVAFIGATLWTDMDNNNPIVTWDAKENMRDYKRIRTGPTEEPWRQKLRPIDTIADHLRAKEYIFEEIPKQREAGNKVVVISHHAPSYQSVAEHYKGEMANGAYVTELGNDICYLEPELWVHGHTHYSFDYMIHNTRIVCNPRGYAPDDLNKDFIDTLILEV